MTNDYRKLYRSSDHRMLGGVAGGLGEFLTIDPTLIRLLFVLGLVLGGAGFWVYLVMWIIVPEEPLEIISSPKPKAPSKKKTTKSKRS